MSGEKKYRYTKEQLRSYSKNPVCRKCPDCLNPNFFYNNEWNPMAWFDSTFLDQNEYLRKLIGIQPKKDVNKGNARRAGYAKNSDTDMGTDNDIVLTNLIKSMRNKMRGGATKPADDMLSIEKSIQKNYSDDGKTGKNTFKTVSEVEALMRVEQKSKSKAAAFSQVMQKLSRPISECFREEREPKAPSKLPGESAFTPSTDGGLIGSLQHGKVLRNVQANNQSRAQYVGDQNMKSTTKTMSDFSTNPKTGGVYGQIYPSCIEQGSYTNAVTANRCLVQLHNNVGKAEATEPHTREQSAVKETASEAAPLFPTTLDDFKALLFRSTNLGAPGQSLEELRRIILSSQFFASLMLQARARSSSGLGVYNPVFQSFEAYPHHDMISRYFQNPTHLMKYLSQQGFHYQMREGMYNNSAVPANSQSSAAEK